MIDHPILFRAPMVRALLDGSKTQTRRVAKFKEREPGINPKFSGLRPAHYMTGQPESGFVLRSGSNDRTFPLHCPHGQPGDRLWVRETFGFNPDHPGILAHACYRADPEHEYDGITWKPSIHMPRAASRILLEIVAVRVERLNDCSEVDALAEGIKDEPCDHIRLSCEEIGCCGPTAKGMFAALWDQINGAGAWAANPWVWVIEFRRVTP